MNSQVAKAVKLFRIQGFADKKSTDSGSLTHNFANLRSTKCPDKYCLD